MTEFTLQQQLAIETIDRNVAVSAGAGSGKTRVLVERFMYILSQGMQSPHEAVDASQILAITFTRKAAGEMKARIRKAMAVKAAADTDGYWRAQLRSLERAQIATIHSLCSRILRENPVEAQLDPSFIMAEDFDGQQFIRQCLRSFIRHELKRGDEDIRRLLGIYGMSSFRNMLEALLPNMQELFAFGDLSAPYEKALADLEAAKEKFRDNLAELLAKRAEYTKAKTAGREKLDNLAAAERQIIKELAIPCADTYLALMKNIRLSGEANELHTELKAIGTAFTFAAADKAALELMPAWERVLQRMDAYLAQTKQEQDFLTFDDLEWLAVKLLLENQQVRHKYQKKFRYIMVDEFQDTNDRQRRLVYLLCGDSDEKLQGRKLFIVGDPKQSIYRFRGADVSVFARARQEIKAGGGAYLTLTKNFRSVDKVLAACNEAFSRLLGEDASQDVFFEALDFNKQSQLRPTLLQIVYSKEDKAVKRRLEAIAVAKKIKELHAGGKEYGKMAILLRAMTNCQVLTKALQQAQVPYLVVDGRGFYELQEVLDILNLLAAALASSVLIAPASGTWLTITNSAITIWATLTIR